jgi:hypothetical protein
MAMKAALVVGVVLAALGIASATDSEPKPPKLLVPAPNQSFTVGTSVTFRVKAEPGERSGHLWLLISRSPAKVKKCGTIGSAAGLEQFRPAGTSGIYQFRTAVYTTDFWTKPGTYYWQAYRIGGKDGCAESEVRRLRVVAVPLAQTPLEGDYRVTQRITGAAGFETDVGDTDHVDWTLKPNELRFGVSEYGITTTGHVIVPLAQQGATYTGSAEATLSKCGLANAKGTFEVRIDAATAAWTRGAWRVTTIRGTTRYSVPELTVAAWHCPAAYWQASFTGVRQ